MRNPYRYIIVVMLCALQANSYAQCPGGPSWLNSPVNGTLKDSARIQVIDTVYVSSTNPTFGSFAAGRPGYSLNTQTWGGNNYETLWVYRGGGAGASTTFKLKIPVDSNVMHFRISDIRGDGFNAETQRILGYRNGVLVSASFKDPQNGATVSGGNLIAGGPATTAAVQSSMRVFFDGPVDSVVITGTSFNDYIIMELAARCDEILPVHNVNITAKLFSSGIQLKWQIPEVIAQIQIEKSTDGNNWFLLKTTNGNVQQFQDVNPMTGINYYRLKIFDAAGRSVYSDIVQANYKQDRGVATKIYPNPFVNTIHCTSGQRLISYRLSSTTGDVIVNHKISPTNNFTENLPPSLAQGWYYITLFFQNGEQQSYKLFKQF